MLSQGLPETYDELEGVVTNSLSAFYLGAAWVTWINRGIDPSCFPAEHVLIDDWNPEILLTDPPESRALPAKNLYQFLLRALIRDCGQFVEYLMDHHDLVPRRKGRQAWSDAPAAIYVLRLLRNGFNHDWTVGDVYADVQWESIYFKKNVGVDAPEGWRKDDPLLPRLPKELGGVEVVGRLMSDVLDELRIMVEESEVISSGNEDD